MAYKLILVKTEQDYCKCDGYDCCCEVNTQEVSVADLATDPLLQNELRYALMQFLEQDDETLVNLMKQKGWINLKDVKDREEKIAAAKQYWWLQLNGRADYNYATYQHFDPSRMTDRTAAQLASDQSQVVQAISKVSLKKLMNAKQKKAYEQARIREKAAKAKKAETANKRRETIQKNKVAKARKVLAEAEAHE